MYKTVPKMTGVGYEHTVDFNGTEHWYLNGEYHREDGPAVILSSGYKVWYLNGKCHRPDGPASVHPDGAGGLWYLNGYKLEPDQVETMKHLLTCDLKELPPHMNTEFKSVVEWRLKNEP